MFSSRTCFFLLPIICVLIPSICARRAESSTESTNVIEKSRTNPNPNNLSCIEKRVRIRVLEWQNHSKCLAFVRLMLWEDCVEKIISDRDKSKARLYLMRSFFEQWQTYESPVITTCPGELPPEEKARRSRSSDERQLAQNAFAAWDNVIRERIRENKIVRKYVEEWQFYLRFGIPLHKRMEVLRYNFYKMLIRGEDQKKIISTTCSTRGPTEVEKAKKDSTPRSHSVSEKDSIRSRHAERHLKHAGKRYASGRRNGAVAGRAMLQSSDSNSDASSAATE